MNPSSIGPQREISPWRWIPTLYVLQALPYVTVMSLSVVMYKNLGLSNAQIGLYTSWLYLPWVIKPLWSPLIEFFGTTRQWIIATQSLVAIMLALVAFSIPTEFAIQLSLALFWLMAFASATHDIAADGFYLAALKQHQQAAYVGVRSTFYRIANLAGQGGIVYAVGVLNDKLGSMALTWAWAIGLLAILIGVVALYHRWALPALPNQDPAPEKSGEKRSLSQLFKHFADVFISFFRKEGIIVILLFLLLFRLGEAQSVKIVTPFFLDPITKGGLGLDNQAVGIVLGTVGVIALTCGGLLGGYLISLKGLKFWLWPMILAVHLPNVIYVFLAQEQLQSLGLLSTLIAVEQFGYGFGFAAYLLYMVMVSEGPHQTAHYSICTGFMALGMMLPGMISGQLQEAMGYTNFFIWVCIATIPSMLVAPFLKIPPSFGKRPGSE